ncbi:S-adenosylmethionine-dependent tRNA (m5U54) methyltransferase [Aureococcus anophagefferens]|nr:S-adenosylmethionine-dependent tRNA (m5U54) methyltransferase [Aureococcus anophagefferens]
MRACYYLLFLVAPFATPWAPPSSTRRAASLTLRATRAPKFFEADSIIDVRVDSLSSLGDGVGRVRSNLTGSDVVVFLPFAAPGDVVRARVTEERKRSCRAAVVEVLEPSPDRAVPRCPSFGACGGCQLQHLTLDAQRRWKRVFLRDALERVGGLRGVAVEATRGGDRGYGYRRKLTPHVTARGALGFQRVGGRGLVDVAACAIADDAVAEQEVRGLRFAHKASEFWQNNDDALPALVDHVVAEARRSGATKLLDCYCGGALRASVAADFAVRGVEVSAANVAAATRNAARNGLGGVATFVVGRAERLFADAADLAFAPVRVVYVSCDPATLARDAAALVAGGDYAVASAVPFDLFPMTRHVGAVVVFDRRA